MNRMMTHMRHVSPGSMFGFPGYKVNGKLAVGLYKTGIIAKVGPDRTQELIGKEGIELFEPMPGRAWKDWVLLTGNFDQHRSIFDEAVQYVLAETTK
jgi:hypothetical protein